MVAFGANEAVQRKPEINTELRKSEKKDGEIDVSNSVEPLPDSNALESSRITDRNQDETSCPQNHESRFQDSRPNITNTLPDTAVQESLWRNKYQLINPSVTIIKEVKMQLLQVENVFYHARGLNSNDLVSYLSPKMDLQAVKLHWEETKIPRLQSLLLLFVYYIFRNKFKKTSHFI